MRAPAILNAVELRGLLVSPAPPRVIDVRTPGEFDAAHIAGAYNVPLDLLREHRDEIRAHLDPACDAQSVVAQLVGSRTKG